MTPDDRAYSSGDGFPLTKADREAQQHLREIRQDGCCRKKRGDGTILESNTGVTIRARVDADTRLEATGDAQATIRGINSPAAT